MIVFLFLENNHSIKLILRRFYGERTALMSLFVRVVDNFPEFGTVGDSRPRTGKSTKDFAR